MAAFGSPYLVPRNAVSCAEYNSIIVPCTGYICKCHVIVQEMRLHLMADPELLHNIKKLPTQVVLDTWMYTQTHTSTVLQGEGKSGGVGGGGWMEPFPGFSL